jgi:transposase
MRENITLSREEQKRLYVLNQIIAGKIVAQQAANLLKCSVRQVRRLLAKYRRDGASALVHGNRGRRPVNRIPRRLVGRVLKLARGPYAGFNQQHFSELLSEREDIQISRSTTRRILSQAGIASPRQRRPAKHRSRRERYPQEGMLVQIDGSPHRWLGRQRDKFTLLAAIDDATGKVLAALFRQQEDAQGYFLLLQSIAEQFGCPLAVYRDRHGVFQRFKKRDLTIAEQLEDQPNHTQFGRLLNELGITSIPAHSPQSKGRIERLFGTFQDRLVSELRLAGASNIDDANRTLLEFLPRYNRRFAVAPQQAGTVYRRLSPDVTLEALFCFKYRRTVGMDNIVRFGEHRIQIQPDPHRSSYARARVEVQQRMDGSIAVYHSDRCLLTTPAPAEAPVLRVQKRRHLSVAAAAEAITKPDLTPKRRIASWKPSKNHPWRRPSNLWKGVSIAELV